MEHSLPSYFVGKTVVELGAGTGLVGIVASAIGAKKVYVTDLAYCLDNARENVALNQMILKGDVVVRELDWCDSLLRWKPSILQFLDDFGFKFAFV